MKVRDLIKILAKQDPEATILCEQVYDGALHPPDTVSVADRTRVTYRVERFTGSCYWTEVDPGRIKGHLPEVLPTVVLR